MAASLEIEFEAFALEDEHGQPPEEDEGADHGGKSAVRSLAGGLSGELFLRDEVRGAVLLDRVQELGLYLGPLAPGPGCNASGFLGADGAIEGLFPPFFRGCLSRLGCTGLFQEQVADDNSAVAFGFDALG
jgi:hypothetical protein